MKTRDDLEELTKAELAEYAEVQGVKVLVLDTKGTMIDKILGEYTEPAEKKVAKPAEKGALPPERGLYDLQGNKINEPMYNLTIYSSESDSSDVSLVVNGHNLLIQRNVEVQVMKPFVDMLKDAVIYTNVQDPDTGIISARQIQKYPHQASPV